MALHTVFSCDSHNVSFADNVFSAATIGHAPGASVGCGLCPGPADVAACFTSPADIWALLQPLPPGRRAISLEGMSSPYYCEDAHSVRYWQDTLDDGSAAPWGDVWAAEVKRRFDTWFGEFARIGGTVDYILSDFELGGHAYWYAFAKQAGSKGRPQEALQRDPRWPTLRARLDAMGARWNVSFDNLSDMQAWTVHDSRAQVWDAVVIDSQVAEYLNTSVYSPIASRFPRVRLSNFAHAYHTDPTGVAGPLPANGWWPHVATSARTPLGTGSHVGTDQSASVYGDPNSTVLLTYNTMNRVRSLPASPFGALLGGQAALRDMRDAALAVPIQPWICPKNATWPTRSTGSWLSADGSDMWQENVLHAALNTGSQTFLWWRPGLQKPDSLGFALVSAVLAELDAVLGYGGAPAGRWRCDVPNSVPIAGDGSTAILGPDDPYLLSGTTLKCVNASGQLAGTAAAVGEALGAASAAEAVVTRRVYRLTPRCLDAPRCAVRPHLVSGAPATIKIASGFVVTPVANGCWWLPPANSSAAGFWVVAPC